MKSNEEILQILKNEHENFTEKYSSKLFKSNKSKKTNDTENNLELLKEKNNNSNTNSSSDK